MKDYMKVVLVDDVVSGQSDNGNDWKKQMVVFETKGENKRNLAVEFMGERKTKMTKTLKQGDLCEVVYQPNSREYQGKWYTRLDGISVRVLEARPAPAEAPAAKEDEPPAPPADCLPPDEEMFEEVV